MSELKSLLREKLHLDEINDAVSTLGIGQRIFVAIAVLMVIGGNAGQLLILNLWVNSMGSIPPAFTVLTVSATTMAFGFVAAILIRNILYPTVNMGFILSIRGLLLTIAIGMCNAFNGVLLVYATQPTPEFMQALLLCTQVFWTLLFQHVGLRDKRSLFTPLVIISFVCVAGGIIVGASPQFSADSPTDSNTKYWTLIFAASMIPGALYNVFASMYMRHFTVMSGEERREDYDEKSPLNIFVNPELVQRKQFGEETHQRSDDTTVKLTMLATTGISQVCWMFILLPIDSAPWFGSSSSIHETTTFLTQGWQCVLQRDYGCNITYAYYIGFNVSYFINYVGSAYLNHFSATLNSMVTQLSAPMAAIVLLIFPTINVSGQAVAIGQSIGAVLMLIVGSILYTLWEQGTRKHR